MKTLIFYFLVTVLAGGVCSIHLACDSPIFCHGPLLAAVQEADIFEDSKTFVDMKLLEQPGVVYEAFTNLTRGSEKLTKSDLLQFLQRYFGQPGTEFENWEPSDWTKSPSVLTKIADPKLKQWAGQVNSYWKMLGKKIKQDVQIHQDRYSLLYLPEPFVIPGERFREFYYWDSYWIVNGLLLSDMHVTARGMISNFLSIVDRYGIVPNGGRVYYTRRSQPPFLTPMMHSYHKVTGDIDFVRDNIHLLEKEYNFWANQRTVKVHKNGRDYHVAHFDVKLDTPRPEGFKEDLELARHKTEGDASRIYGDVASACETGWDFSSRWFAEKGNDKFTLHSIRTSQIAPVDLNSILWWNEKILADFYSMLGHMEKAGFYQHKADERATAIHDLMWNDEEGSWFDYDLQHDSHRKFFYPSNMVPLFVGCYGSNDLTAKTTMEQKVMNYLLREEVLTFPGGLPTSKLQTGQQWDSVNAWAPLVHMMVEGLASTSLPQAHQEAFKLAQKWIVNNWLTWQSKGHMYEKYSAAYVGTAGSGGEYNVQIGFGWTNGVVLLLLDKYGSMLQAPMTTPSRVEVQKHDAWHYVWHKDYTVVFGGCAGLVLMVAITMLARPSTLSISSNLDIPIKKQFNSVMWREMFKKKIAMNSPPRVDSNKRCHNHGS